MTFFLDPTNLIFICTVAAKMTVQHNKTPPYYRRKYYIRKKPCHQYHAHFTMSATTHARQRQKWEERERNYK
jgi:hypothetical protein